MYERICLIILLLFTKATISQDIITVPEEKLYNYFGLTGRAAAQGDHLKAALFLDSALQLAPDFSPIRLGKARQLALGKEYKGALAELQKIIDKKQAVILTAINDSVFNSVRNIQQIKQQLSKVKKPVNNSKTAFVIDEVDLIPEGIAYDPVRKRFFIGSYYKRKIIQFNEQGRVDSFGTNATDNLLPVLGMEVDTKKNILWVCCAQVANEKDSVSRSLIAKYDLSTDKLIKTYTLNDANPHFFNDITILPNGDIYFTDSQANAVYKISANDEQITLFLDKPILHSANGITHDDQGKNLFISSYLRGVIKHNLATGKWLWLKSNDPSSVLSGVDGLAYYKGSLIANSPTEIRGIVRYTLNDQKNAITKYQILESNNPLVQQTTTGVIVGNSFYYIANSSIEYYDDKKGQPDYKKITKPVIMKMDLK